MPLVIGVSEVSGLMALTRILSFGTTDGFAIGKGRWR